MVSNADGVLADFADAWERGDRYAELRARFGLSTSAITELRRKLGLPPRGKDCYAKPAKDAPAEAEIRLPYMAPHPFWTPARDLAVLQTAGVYRAIEALARDLGKPAAVILQRWHRLRAA